MNRSPHFHWSSEQTEDNAFCEASVRTPRQKSSTAFPVPLGSTSTPPLAMRPDSIHAKPMFPDAQRDDHISSSTGSNSSTIPDVRSQSANQGHGRTNYVPDSPIQECDFRRNHRDHGALEQPNYSRSPRFGDHGIPNYSQPKIANDDELERRRAEHHDDRYGKTRNKEEWKQYDSPTKAMSAAASRQSYYHAEEMEHMPRLPQHQKRATNYDDEAFHRQDIRTSHHKSARLPATPSNTCHVPPSNDYSGYYNDESDSYESYGKKMSSAYDNIQQRRQPRSPAQSRDSENWIDHHRQPFDHHPQASEACDSFGEHPDSFRGEKIRDHPPDLPYTQSEDRRRDRCHERGQSRDFEKLRESSHSNSRERARVTPKRSQEEDRGRGYREWPTESLQDSSKGERQRHTRDLPVISTTSAAPHGRTRRARSNRNNQVFEEEEVESLSESSESIAPPKRSGRERVLRERPELQVTIPKTPDSRRRRSKSRDRQKEHDSLYEVSFSPSTDLPLEQFDLLNETESSCSSIEKYAKRVIGANLLKEQSEARHQIMCEIRQANEMRKTATDDSDRIFWNKQLDTLNVSLKNLFSVQSSTAIQEPLSSRTNFELADGRREVLECVTSEYDQTPATPTTLSPPTPTAATIKVRAPEDLSGGHQFTVRVDGKPIVLKVPEGGVLKGDCFSICLSGLDCEINPTPRPVSVPARVRVAPVSLQTPCPPSATVKVWAPASLPGGYRFTAKSGSGTIVAVVPKAGVKKGEVFVALIEED